MAFEGFKKMMVHRAVEDETPSGGIREKVVRAGMVGAAVAGSLALGNHLEKTETLAEERAHTESEASPLGGMNTAPHVRIEREKQKLPVIHITVPEVREAQKVDLSHETNANDHEEIDVPKEEVRHLHAIESDEPDHTHSGHEPMA